MVTVPFLMIAFLFLCRISVHAGGEQDRLAEYSQQLEMYRKRSDSIALRIAENERRLDSLAETEGNQLRLIQELEEMIAESQERLAHALEEREVLEQEQQHIADSLEHLQQEYESRRAFLKQRLRHMNTLGEPHILEFLLGGRSPHDLMGKMHYARLLTERDRELLSKLEWIRMRLSVDHGRLQLKEEQIALVVKEQEEEANRFYEQKHRRHEKIAQIQEGLENHRAMVEELRQAQEEMDTLIAGVVAERDELARQLERMMDFSDMKGEMQWPVSGTLVQKFGRVVHPEYQTVTRSNGIKIRANVGVAVHAVAPGIVSYTGTLRGYGRIVMIAHEGGYTTVYAHLSDIAVSVGDPIDTRDVLGAVGESGSLEGPRLHFEIRRDAQAEDPLNWLSPDSTPTHSEFRRGSPVLQERAGGSWQSPVLLSRA
ncbi:murein hydrolase activator EnvC family protein [Chitinivibrio alkaliphilus]|uniref:murein hydrolase activator EnvC family protein n=1 Tax=Chitinivibrio alkaliphilus TaxID=1505232 RepID=UPI00069640B6|nr:peptidoglycan DD-metalloendopeptidase family protein [Chitinivibrio alkaliphilus]